MGITRVYSHCISDVISQVVLEMMEALNLQHCSQSTRGDNQGI